MCKTNKAEKELKETSITHHSSQQRQLLAKNPFLARVRRWRKKSVKPFYKFLKPCQHKLYRPGDSWCEELGMSENTVRKHMKLVCTSYSSQKAFNQQEDPFKGMPVASYFNRLRKITWFLYNPQNDHILEKTPKNSPQLRLRRTEAQKHLNFPSIAPRSTEEAKRREKESKAIKNYLSKSPLKTQASQSKTLDDFRNNSKKPLTAPPLGDKERDLAAQMHVIWRKTAKIPTPRLTDHFSKIMINALKVSFKSSLELWQKYCLAIASSRFLTGFVTKFKAWLVWAIRGDVIEKIKQGLYGIIEPYSGVLPAIFVTRKEVLTRINETLDRREKAIRMMLLNHFGKRVYHSWFADVGLQIKGTRIAFKTRNSFVFDSMSTRFKSELSQLFKHREIEIR